MALNFYEMDPWLRPISSCTFILFFDIVIIIGLVQFKRFFIVNPHFKKTYNRETFHGHCYNALRA